MVVAFYKCGITWILYLKRIIKISFTLSLLQESIVRNEVNYILYEINSR